MLVIQIISQKELNSIIQAKVQSLQKEENGKFITETLVTHKNSSINIVKKEVPILD